jgi:uncharacterized protein YcaQ
MPPAPRTSLDRLRSDGPLPTTELPDTCAVPWRSTGWTHDKNVQKMLSALGKRLAEIFEYDYALEMYKPAAQRIWGYWALPVLYGDRLIGKADAIAEREEGELIVRALYEDEPWSPSIRADVVGELESLARWLDLALILP